MRKTIQSAPFFPGTNEPTVRLLGDESFLKTASEVEPHHYPEIERYLRNVKPEDGYSYILILALGSSQYYGCNRNGDWFDEDELKGWYKTFETNPARLYRHHQNKDPENAAGKVVKAFWNPIMRRVEIVVRMDNNKAPDVVEKLKSGVPVATSMGCKVKYDMCSECGNMARNRGEYCDHLRQQMRHIFEDGRQIYAVNKEPKFFDISLVFRPADRTSYVLRKVASETALFDDSYDLSPYNSATIADVEEKVAAIGKISDITKIIRGIPTKAKIDGEERDLISDYRDKQLPHLMKDVEELPPRALDKMRGSPLITVIRIAKDNGYSLSTPEMCKLMIGKQTGERPSQVSDMPGRIISMILPHILDLLSNREDLVERVTSESPEFTEDRGEEEKVSQALAYFPDSRQFDYRSLIKKAARPQHSWSTVSRAWRNLLSLDGPGRHETVTVKMSDGRELIVPREEMLNAVVFDSLAITRPIRSATLGLSALAAGAAHSIISPYSSEYEPFLQGPDDIMSIPGVRGYVKKSSLELPGYLNTVAFDYILSGGNYIGEEIEHLKSASYEEVVEFIGDYISEILDEIY